MDEIVALYSLDGHETGESPRSVVRAKNLHHAATQVVLFDEAGRIFVHRRTPLKDVYPGVRDFAAGGVMRPGERPDEAAARELEEELGVHSALHPLGQANYSDEHTSFHGFLYWAISHEELRLQKEEVAGGEWMSREALLTAIDDEPADFMPDTVALLGDWLRRLEVVPPLPHDA